MTHSEALTRSYRESRERTRLFCKIFVGEILINILSTTFLQIICKQFLLYPNYSQKYYKPRRDLPNRCPGMDGKVLHCFTDALKRKVLKVYCMMTQLYYSLNQNMPGAAKKRLIILMISLEKSDILKIFDVEMFIITASSTLF